MDNRRAFGKAMKKAGVCAHKEAWDKAIKEYTRALKIRPGDTTALVGLGVAYLESDQLQSARETFKEVQLTRPEDPDVIGYLATLEERVGNVDKASAFLMDLGRIYTERGDLEQAVDTWTKAVRLVPTSCEGYLKLVQAYTDLDRPDEAVSVCLSASQKLQTQGRKPEMVRMLRLALQADPRNEEAARLLAITHVASGDNQPADDRSAGPTELARKAAWCELAQMVFEGPPAEMGGDAEAMAAAEHASHHDTSETQVEEGRVLALIGRAVDLDSQGHAAGAIRAYEDALSGGADRVALQFALGLLYKSQDELDRACQHLLNATAHPDYALASDLALGECYESLRQAGTAMKHYVRALEAADLRVVSDTRAPEIAAIYDSVIARCDHVVQDELEQPTIDLTTAIGAFFHSQDWLERVAELRTCLDGLSTVGITISLLDGLKTRDLDRALSALSEARSLEYRGMLATAQEVCYRAIEREPAYLPYHFRLADIHFRRGMVSEAVKKHMIIAQFYETDGDYVQAANVYRAILSMTPLDTAARSRLIELLILCEDVDQALEQYLALADAYYQLARVDQALETFNEALRLAKRSPSENAWQLRILHCMADLHTQRVEWNQAIEVYKEIRGLAPQDDQAALYLVDLYFKQGRTEKAMQELQELLKPYEEKGDFESVVRLLGEAVRLRPTELPVRTRLSRACIEAGMKEQAIEELDAIGEMQLEANMRDDAIQTIRLIVSLNPPNAKAYKQLLYSLLG